MEAKNLIYIPNEIIENISDLISIFDCNGRRLYMNPAYLKYLDNLGLYLENETLAEVHPEDRDKVKRFIFDIQSKQYLEPIDYRLVTNNGDVRYFEARGVSLKGGDGKIYCTLISSDVTEHLQIKRELRMLAYALSRTKDCLCVIDNSFQILFVNDTFCDTYGYSVDEIVGQSIDVIHTAKDLNEINNRLFTPYIDSGIKLELIDKRKDGKEFPVEVWASSIKNDQGENVGYLLNIRDLTDRKQVEEEKQKFFYLIQSVLNATHDGILVVDTDGKIVSYNKKFVDMWRIPKEVVETRDDEKALSFVLNQLKYPEEFLKKVYELYSNLEAESYDIIEFKDGRVFERYSRPQQMGDKFIGRVWSFHDITEQKKSEKIQNALYRIAKSVNSTKSLNELFKSIHEIVNELISAENFYIALYNEQNETISFPYFIDAYEPPPQPQKLGRGLTEFIIRTGKPYHVTPALFEELTQRNEVDVVGPPAFDWLGVPLKMDGKVIGVLVVQSYTEGVVYSDEDLDMLIFVSSQVASAIERKRTEEALLQSEDKYRSLFEESKDAIIITTVQGKIIDVNSAGVELLGCSSKDEVLQVENAAVFYVDSKKRDEFKKSLEKNGYIKDFEFEIRRRDGQIRIVSETASAVYDENRKISAFRCFVRDITEKKILEQQLLQAQKMESIGTIAGGIAHDFNNILGIILGYTTLLRRENIGTEKFFHSLDAITNAVQRGANLVSQMLTFARKSNVVLQPIDPNILISDIKKILDETFPKNINIITKLTQEKNLIIADTNQLHQAILNLCVNARDAMPNGGDLVLYTETVAKNYLQEKFPEADSEQYIGICVTDTGCGMDEQTITRIFEPFFTTKEFGKGTGLGLSVVYGIVKNHDGFIDVKSKVNEGTTFKLYFPIRHEEIKVETENKTASLPSQQGHETLLIVEDEEMLRDLLKSMLEDQGYRVYAAEDGEEAVSLFQQHQHEIQLVLSDMGLPKLGGWEAFQKMKQLNPKVKAILASGYLDPHLREEMIKGGAKDFVQKPYDPENIIKKIREIIDEKD